MNRAKTIVATAVVAACSAWPLAVLAQSGASGSSGYGSTGSGSGSSGSGSMGSGSYGSPPGTVGSGTTGTAPSSRAVTTSDSDFVARAASGGMLEVAASKLALERTQNSEVRNFATRMIDDHTRTNRDLMAAARSAGVTDVPTTMTSSDRNVLERLSAARGPEFDRMYAEQVGLTAHHETVALFQREANQGTNPELKAFAARTLPELRGHLEQTQAVATAVGVPMDRMQAYGPTMSAPPPSSLAGGSAAVASSAGAAGMGSSSTAYSRSSLDSTTGQAGAWTGDGLVGPYVGASLGQSNYSSDSCSGQCDKNRFAGKVFGGYMFTPWIGVEADYGWFGTAKINTVQFLGGTPFNTTADVKTDGFSGFVVGQYPVDNFRVFGKLGFSRLNTSVNASVNGLQVVDNNDASFEFAWGVGASYMFDRNLGVRAEYEARKYKFEGDKNTLGLWSVGVQYHF